MGAHESSVNVSPSPCPRKPPRVPVCPPHSCVCVCLGGSMAFAAHGRYGGTEVVVMTAGEGDGLEPGPDGEPARKRRGTATV
jgi:hypothetical protein